MIIKNKSVFFESAIVFLFLCILSIITFKGYCKIYKNFGFDDQVLATWGYSSYSGLLPYKDTFYPYGLFSYYESNLLFFQLISFFLSPILYTLVFIIFRNVWQDKLYTLISFVIFYLFIERYTGSQTFERYGIIIVFASIAALYFYKNTFLSKLAAFIYGVSIGVIFSLFHDQGIYGFLIVFIFIFINPVLRKRFEVLRSARYYKYIFLSICILISGIFIGVLPFFVFLFKHNIVYDFVGFILKLSDPALYAKTSFIPYSRSPENIFTFLALFLTVFLIVYKVYFKKQKQDKIFYLQISLTLVIILLEQKSLIRSIASSITFVALILYIFLFYEFEKLLNTYKIRANKILIYFIVLGAFTVFRLQSLDTAQKKEKLESSACLKKNINNFLAGNKDYALVKQKLGNELGYKGKIFSFPGDPIFYMLNKQMPPYYSNVYDSSSFIAQKKQIEYIKESDIQYIIYNKKVLSIQDGVPDFIRANFELKFILNNFTPVDKVGDLLLFKKDSGNDIFKEKFLYAVPQLRKYLLQVDFAAIPKSEGLHKKSFVKSNNNIIFSKSSVQNVNSFLANESIKSDNTVFVVWGSNENQKGNRTSITLKTNENLETTIFFHQCSNRTPCIINLSRIPLFYKKRIIEKIIVGPSFKDLIEIRNRYDDNELW